MKGLVTILFSVFIVVNISAQKKITIDLFQAINSKTKTVMLSDIASDIRYIPLETNPDCLIGNDYSISYEGDAIFAASREERFFYHFDKNGNFKNQIGRKGQGPGEYNVGLFYFVDSDKKLFYTQDFVSIHCYTYDGQYRKKIETPELNMGTAEKLGNEHIVYSNDMYFYKKDPQHNQLFVIDINGNKVNKFRGKIEEGKKYGVNLTTRDFMYIFKGDTYFKPALENTVYKLSSPKKKTVAWEFYTGTKGIDVSKIEIDPQKRGEHIYVFRIQETDKYMFVLYGLHQDTYVGMFNKQTGEFSNVEIKDDLSGGIDFVPSGKCPEGFLINAYFPKTFKDNKKHGKGSLPKRVEELKSLVKEKEEDDNPVLILVTLKE